MYGLCISHAHARYICVYAYRPTQANTYKIYTRKNSNTHTHIRAHAHAYNYIYTYMYIYTHECVCVCASEHACAFVHIKAYICI